MTYTRGKDLSGSLEGAGGIGGLLARSHGYSGGNWSTHSFYHADGNGNITCLINSAATPSVVASYKYDPYGRAISATGSLADANLYRFSSKEFVASCGLYYYLYRFYDPVLQRWLNRDPIAELGNRLLRGRGARYRGIWSVHPNLFRFCRNESVSRRDPFGLLSQEDCDSQYRIDVAEMKKEGAACLHSALKWGIVLEVVLGGGGAAGGAVATRSGAGAGIGLFCGTVAAGAIDMSHYSHCMENVNKKREFAEESYKWCVDNIDE